MFAGRPGEACESCHRSVDPIVAVRCGSAGDASVLLCVVCLAESIDQVTGWRMTSNVRQALLVGNAGERFHHPERFAKPSKRTPREVLQNNRERRAARAVKVVQSDVPIRHVEMWE